MNQQEAIAECERRDEIISSQKAEIERLNEKVQQLTKLLDDQFGTPCEQIRHQQEIERLRVVLQEIVKLKDPPFNWRGEYSHAIHIAQNALLMSSKQL